MSTVDEVAYWLNEVMREEMYEAWGYTDGPTQEMARKMAETLQNVALLVGEDELQDEIDRLRDIIERVRNWLVIDHPFKWAPSQASLILDEVNNKEKS